MKCPNCGLPQPEGAETCEACGLIFAKWRERQAAQAPAPPPQGASPENAAPEQAIPTPALNPEQAAASNKSSPLLERQYHEFPMKKVLWISGILLVGVGIFVFTTSKPEEKPAYALLPHPTSLAGTLYETVVPTDTPWPTTPTPTAIPMTIAGAPWVFFGKVVDCLHLAPAGGVSLIFSNNGVVVTAVSDAQGHYQISVPPLSGNEAYEVQLSNPSYREGYWLDDSSSLSEQERLARYYDFQEGNSHLSGLPGGGGERHMDFSLYPAQLSEQESMHVQNARPSGQ